MTYRVELLGGDHALRGFDCGNDELNTWLIHHARNATGQGTRTYVLVDEKTQVVTGYFAIAPHLVERDSVSKKVARGAPRQIPAILLAKLAFDRGVQGRGLGSDLLVRALETIVDVAKVAGGKLVIIGAVDDGAVRFYERHDFDRIPGSRTRLVKKLSTIAAALGRARP